MNQAAQEQSASNYVPSRHTSYGVGVSPQLCELHEVFEYPREHIQLICD